ncbi:MAG TPA: transglutaminase-like domain-containing protein [Anaerolineales bacterium]
MHSRWDWIAAALLTSAVFTAAVRLDSTNWTPDLGYVESFAVLGTLLGLALGLSQYHRSATSWLAGLYTLTVVPMQLSRIITSEETPLGQMASLGGRLAVSINLLFSGKAIEDHLFFVSIMSLVFWLIGIYSGFKLVREGNIFQVLLPSTLPILIIQYYDGYQPERIWGLAFYFFLALMLAGRINLLNSRERWEAHRVVAGSDPEFDLNKNIASVAAVIILAAWLLPAPSAVIPTAARAWRNLNEPFENVRKRFDDILAALDSSRTTAPGALYGDTMGLGRSAGTGDTELFNVKAPRNNLPRLYWRMRAYDQYQNGVWQTINSENNSYDPQDGNIIDVDAQPLPVAEFNFGWQTGESAMLVTPAQPIWTSRKGSIQIASSSGAESDPLSWNVTPVLQSGDQYQVRTLLANPTQKELRLSGVNYPDWVTENYLQVPDIISAAYSRLAHEITDGLPTNFDKAEAVTEYLRKNITYRETIPAAPKGVDPLNYFLFDWKTGFCNYYASSEVMLLRSIGIPARMVVGFAQGDSGETGFFSVRGKDTHAWPEVYFPGSGWVEFEPTVSQAVLVRPSGERATPLEPNPGGNFADNSQNNPRFDQEKDAFDTGGETSITPTFLGLNRNTWIAIASALIALAIMSVFAWNWQRRKQPGAPPFAQLIPRTVEGFFIRFNLKTPSWVEQWMQWSEASAAERAFHAVNQALHWLDEPQANNVTSAERAERLKALLPAASEEVDTLSTTLEKTLFTPHPIDAANAMRAGWRLRLFTIRKIIQRRLYGE